MVATKVVTICTPKGGVGKSTIAANLAVKFSQSNYKTIIFDLDPQQTLFKWSATRRNVHTDVPKIECVTSELSLWGTDLSRSGNYDIVIFDLPPGLIKEMLEVKTLCKKSDIVLVPTGSTPYDLDSAGPWIKALSDINVSVSSILNRVNPRETYFKAAQIALNNLSDLCPIVVRQLTDAYQYAIDGLTASDKPKCRSYPDFDGVYRYVCRKIGIRA
ncbi:ParA family protein [Acetobacteraceae bacterium ESL0709]|nr:ParA family protein [Acetobacteraceae bacterium ESL0697]MDF7679028.1 ParA family protein [Acetobacteraceae bacterium ESL0709]